MSTRIPASVLLVLFLVLATFTSVDGAILCIERHDDLHVAIEFGHCDPAPSCLDPGLHGCRASAHGDADTAGGDSSCGDCLDIALTGPDDALIDRERCAAGPPAAGVHAPPFLRRPAAARGIRRAAPPTLAPCPPGSLPLRI